MRLHRFVFLLLAVAALASCHDSGSPTSPLDVPKQYGRLSGLVTIGPNCPVEHIGDPCPTSPEAYDARKVLVYDATHTNVLFTVDIDHQGRYFIDLVPNTYTVDVKKVGVDRSSNVPKVITITPNAIVVVDIGIDTGVR